MAADDQVTEFSIARVTDPDPHSRVEITPPPAPSRSLAGATAAPINFSGTWYHLEVGSPLTWRMVLSIPRNAAVDAVGSLSMTMIGKGSLAGFCVDAKVKYKYPMTITAITARSITMTMGRQTCSAENFPYSGTASCYGVMTFGCGAVVNWGGPWVFKTEDGAVITAKKRAFSNMPIIFG